MFDFIHRRKRLIQVVLGLIVIPFAFFGLESYTRGTGGANDVAKVDGMIITQKEFAEELKQQQDRLRSMFGRNFDPAIVDTPEARRVLLDGMIAKRVVAREIARANVAVSDESLRAAIGSIPAFQREGKFSHANYETLLRAQGMTPAGFEAQMRYDMALGLLSRAIAGTAIAPRSIADRLATLEGQKYEVAESMIPAQRFFAQIKLDEGKLKAYYGANAPEFRTPERMRAEYLVLSAEDIARQAQPTEAEVKSVYEARSGQFRVGEQRRASHILIQAAPGALDTDRKAARAKAEDLLAQVKKNPGNFSEVARKNSQDTGSADKGGDLGFFGQGMMVKPFENAAYALKEGETSPIVESEFGYHIIRLTGIRGSTIRSFEEVRNELLAELKQQKAAQKFAESAENFANLVYEQAGSLSAIAERFGLKAQTSDWIVNDPASAPKILANQKLLNALFASDSVKTRRNTDAIEVAPNTLVAARVLEHQPATTRAYEEVKPEIERKLRQREAAKLALKEGAELLEQVKKGADAGLKWGPTLQVGRNAPQGLSTQALSKVVSAEGSKLPAVFGIVKGDEGYAIYRVTKVSPPDPKPEAQKKADVGRIETLFGSSQYDAFVSSLRARADVKINEKNLEKR